MRLNNNSRIISEDDIILSDGKSTLSDNISSIKDDISKLKSNVKWIYKYGGVGSGSGNGGGGTVKEFSIYATLDGTLLKDLNIVLDGIGNHELVVKINNPNGYQYNVQYLYTTKSANGNVITLKRTLILSIQNNYQFTVNINLNNNASLTIIASNGETTLLVSCNYITLPYIFDIYVIDDNGDKYEASNDSYEIFIETAKTKGLNIQILYNINITADILYLYQFGNDDAKPGKIEDKNNNIIFPIDKSFFVSDNAGLYNAYFNVDIIPEGQEKIQSSLNISISLIPKNLYALILPESGVIYTSENEDPYIYNPGYIVFNYRIYEGVNEGRSYTVDAYLNDTQVSQESVTERQQNKFRVFATNAGKNKLTVRVLRQTIYEVTYYFYVAEQSLKVDWFEEPNKWTQYYYRIDDCTDLFSKYKNSTYIQLTVNLDTIRIEGLEPPDTSGDGGVNTHIAIGYLYNYINQDNPTIFEFYNGNSNPILIINLQSVEGSNGKSAKYYIKQEYDVDATDTSKYHLLQIYSKYIKKIGNLLYYEVSFYIDSVLEAVFPSLGESALFTRLFEILPINGYINCIDIDYKEAQDTTGNCDLDVYLYYLKYKNQILREDISELWAIRNNLAEFNVGLDGRIKTNYSTINNIASGISTPVLLLTYQNPDPNDNFIERIEKNYGEDGSSAGSDLNFPVSVLWGKGNAPLTEILFPSGYDSAQFRAALQGSSTKLYRVKNFNLSIENTDESDQADTYLYSPNFNNNDTSTFLPESVFTLKADVVDSSHSNNTSCGKFINTVCRKFSNDINDSSKYKSYVRNCLEGFPVLLFFNIVTVDPTTQDKIEEYYYFGVYNFNLGRSSYFNLGYKDLDVLGDSSTLQDAGDSFTFFKLSHENDTIREGMGVAEIQGGSNYFDFSQYDSSILFELEMGGNAKDSTYMFGDLVHGANFTDALLKSKIQELVQYTALGGGYLFDYLKKTKGDYSDGYHAEEIVDGQYTGNSLNLVPNYNDQYKRELSSVGTWEYSKKETIENGTSDHLKRLIITDTDNGVPAILNYQSISEYYTICMVLGLVDSVMKNLNIKTWTGANSTGTTWYAAFYDMDTCLGINNKGGNINYFAFSDYWNSQITKTVDGVDYPNSVIIYRDFSPNSLGENGFDVPSSYLFAVAKYAKLIFPDEELYTVNFPLELYAKWRSNTINTETNEGVLKDADHFILNFYSNNLGSVNNLLITYNYRSKYFSLGDNSLSTSWISTDYEKFNGTRINYVKDWMQGRLHILDAYFNLNQTMITNFAYLEDGLWKILKYGDKTVMDFTYLGKYSIDDNQDVIILRDIFSSGSTSAGIQLVGSMNFLIKCPPFSPLLICNANASTRYNYILGGDNYQNISFTTTGAQVFKLGGSQAWTYLSNINWINASGSALYMKSDKLQNIYGSSGSFGSILLETPNVKTILLNSSGHQGTLSIKDTSSYPNLNYINISKSKMSLNLNGTNVLQVNVSNIKNSLGSVSISNCSTITSFDISGSSLSSFTWNSLSGKYKNLTLGNTNITNISVSCIEDGGTFTISGDQTVENISLQGFNKIVISNCQKLKTVKLSEYDKQYITSVSITNCLNSSLIINSTNNDVSANTVDLSNLKHLASFSISDDTTIEHVSLPSGITGSFYNCISLKDVDCTELYVLNQTFYHCKLYAMKNSSGGRTGIKVKDSTTSISDSFSNTSVTWSDAVWFFNNSISELNSLTDISYTFWYCQNISYLLSDYKSDLNSNNLLDLSKLKKITNASGLFGYTSVNVLFKELLSFGVDSGCNYNIINSNTAYAELDCLANCVNKVKYVSFANLLTIINQGVELPSGSTVKLSDLLSPGGVHPTKLVSISNLNIVDSVCQDFDGAFTKDFVSLTSISSSFNNAWYKNFDKALYNLPNLKSLTDCFTYSSNNSVSKIDLYQFINWERYVKNGGNFSFNGFGNVSFSFPRYIYYQDYLKLCNLYLNSNINSISGLFRNTGIIGLTSDDELTFGDTSIINNKIKYTIRTYDGTYYMTDKDSDIKLPIKIGNKMFKNLPAVSNVSYMFANTLINSEIPFDFFNKRYNAQANKKIYVKKNDEYISATLYQYDYSRVINVFTGIFYGCSFTSGHKLYTPQEIDMNRAEDADGNVYDVYYTTRIDQSGNTVYDEHTIELNTEYTDCQNLSGKYIASVSYGSNGFIYNASIDVSKDSTDKLIIPPDFFYCATDSHNSEFNDGGITSYSYAFNCSKAQRVGIIPKNIFKNLKNGYVQSVFKDLAVIPTLVYTGKSNGLTVNLYALYPEKYSTRAILDNAFDSIPMALPNESNIKNYSVVILQDTLPLAVNSLLNAFGYSLTGPNATGGDYELNAIGKIENGLVLLGFDMIHFNNLYMDYMYSTNLTRIGKGNLFNTEYDIHHLKLQSDSYVAYICTSSNIIYPKATGSIAKFIGNKQNSYIPSANITDSDTSVQWYKNAGINVT